MLTRTLLTGLCGMLAMPLASSAGSPEQKADAVAAKSYDNSAGLVANVSDPFVFKHGGSYYLYGTRDGRGVKGIVAYKSEDMVNWGKPAGARDGYALHRDDVWGDKWFWSPEVIHANGRFYMIYTVEERLAVATSDSPLGPFTQPRPGKTS